MVISVGVGKTASDCRMILEAVSEMNFSVNELMLLAPILKALLGTFVILGSLKIWNNLKPNRNKLKLFCQGLFQVSNVLDSRD